MTNLYIIGNGFDLDLGLKTKYSDFILSSEFQNLIQLHSNCLFSKYLFKKFNEELKWMDIENELKVYINNIYDQTGTDFKSEFIQFKKTLITYLQNQVATNSFNYSSNAARICDKILDDLSKNINVRIVNFNYTNTVPIIVKKLNSDRYRKHEELEKIIYNNPHGEIKKGIVFGVEDNALIQNKKDFLYLIKGADPIHEHQDWHKSYTIANEITIFGHSLGDSDFDTFEPMFDYLMTVRDFQRTLKFYYLDKDEDYYNERLEKFTKGRITALSINHLLLRNPSF